MKLNFIYTSLIIGTLTACASTLPTLSEAYHNELLKVAPGLEKCEAIDKVYTDLTTAPAEVVAGISPEVREVWTLKGCEDGTRKRAELNIFSSNDGALSFSEY